MFHVLSTVIAAAEGGAEHSKTAFYVCGGLLAAWAVVLAAIGMSHATFPESAGAQRGVQLLSAVFVAAAMATAVITA
jgi:hypothetical protein